MKITKVIKVKTLFVGVMTMAILFCWSGQVKAAQDGDYTYNVTNGKAQIEKYTGSGGVVTIPDTLGGVAVTSIGYAAFSGCIGLTSISIPSGVTNIGEAAFIYCEGLTTINLPQGLTSIGNSAFLGCTGLSTISIPEGVAIIDHGAFYNCTSITTISIPPSVISIGSEAFFNCTSLASITFNSATTAIYDNRPNIIPAATKIIGYDPSSAKDYAALNGRTFEVIGTTGNDLSIGQQNTTSMTIAVFQNESDMLSSSDRYVACADATITVGGATYPTNSAGTAVISVSNENTTVSKNGYLSATLSPGSLLSSNKIYLEKVGGEMPLIKSVTLGGVNVRAETATINEDMTGNIMVDIDWNGNTKSLVYIRQGITTIPVNVGQTGDVALGNLLKSNDDIYLYVKATNGKEVKKKISIKTESLSEFSGISNSLNNFEVFPQYIQQVGESASFLNNMEMGFGLPFIPVSFGLENNKISVLIGGSVGGSRSWEKDGQAKMAFNTLKDIKKSGRDVKSIWKQYSSLKPISPTKGKFAVDGDFTVAGYLEGEVILIGGQYTLNITDSFIIIDGEVGYDAQYPVYAPPPVFLEWYIKGGIEAKLNLDYQNALIVNEQSTITGKIALGGGIGVGIPAIISIAGGAEGEVTALYPFTKPIEPDVDLDVNVWAKGTFIGMTIPNPPFKMNLVKLHLIPPQPNMAALSLNAEELDGIINTNDAVPIPRDYLNQPSNFVANDSAANTNMMMLSTTPAHEITAVIKTNVYPQSSPQLVSLGNNEQLLVWLDDDPSRNEYNRTSLMYSYYNGTIWSDPQAVDNDGTADFSPQLKNVNGTPYLVWQNAKTTFDETVTVETMSAGMEIAVSKYDINTHTFATKTNLSNDSLIDMLPKISGNSTDLSVVWVKNLGNDIFGLTARNELMLSTFDGTNWSSPTAVYENLNAIDDLTVGYSSESRIIAYTLDVDNDINTVNDKELFINGVKITTNEVLDSKPDFAANKLYWYSGGQISYIDNFTTNEIHSILPEGQVMPNDRFEILSNANGDSSIVFEKSEGIKSELYSFIYDKTADRWSSMVKLTQLDSKIDGFGGYLDNSGVIESAFNKVAVVGEIGTSEPYGQADLCTFEVSPVYNLSMNDVFYSADKLVAGNDLELKFDVTNNGELTDSYMTVQILDSNDNRIFTTELAKQLMPGETKECIAIYRVPENFTSRDIKVNVTPKGQDDFDLVDNIKTVNLNYIDVAVEDLYCGKKADGTKIIYAQIVNRSLNTLSNIEVSLVENTPEGTVLETKTIESLDSLDVNMVTFEQTVTENKVFYVVVKPVENETMSGNNNDFIVVNVVDLTTAISNATDLLTSKTVGSAVGNVSRIAYDAYNSAITSAYIVQNNASATQVEVVVALNVLEMATIAFNEAIIPAAEQPVDECFIATAAFGSKFTWPVVLLRHFRDQYLLTNSWGTAFVKFYYRQSPPIAAMIASSQPLKILVRIVLAPVIALIYLMYHPLLLAIIFMLLVVFFVYRSRLWRSYFQA